MKELCFIFAMVFGLGPVAQARRVAEPTVAYLFEYAPLAITCEVSSIETLGIETTLSYAPLRRIPFHWLRVTCRVDTVLKGKFSKDSIDVAMLALKNSDNAWLINGPLMVSPAIGQKYAMFLAPSSKQAVYTSVLAPYDEANAIFILDRKARKDDCSGILAEDLLKHCLEKKDFLWSLVNDDAQFSAEGAAAVAQRYKSQIKMKSPRFMIPLEWKMETNAQGWSTDVPKGYRATERQMNDVVKKGNRR